MTGVNQIVWTPGEAMTVRDQRPADLAPVGVGIDNRTWGEVRLLTAKVEPAQECHHSQRDQEKGHCHRTHVRISSRTSTRNARPKA